MRAFVVTVGAILISTRAFAADPYDTKELESLNWALYKRTINLSAAFQNFDPVFSRQGKFYQNLLDQLNTAHYAAEEYAAVDRLIRSNREPLAENVFRRNGAYRMRQICYIANLKVTDLAENNSVPGTKVDVAQIAGAVGSICTELDRLWNAEEPPRSNP